MSGFEAPSALSIASSSTAILPSTRRHALHHRTGRPSKMQRGGAAWWKAASWLSWAKLRDDTERQQIIKARIDALRQRNTKRKGGRRRAAQSEDTRAKKAQEACEPADGELCFPTP